MVQPFIDLKMRGHSLFKVLSSPNENKEICTETTQKNSKVTYCLRIQNQKLHHAICEN